MINNLWMMGIQGSCLILLILAARWVLSRRNCPRSWCYGLWMLVGFRLLCPIFIESSGGIQPDLRKLWTQEQTEAGVSKTTDGKLSRNSMETEDSVEPGKSMAESEEQLSDLSSGQTRNHYDLLKLLRWAYGAGVCATAAVLFLQYVRLKKCVATAVREEKRIGMKEEVWLSEQISSPFVMGIFRHKIYLPYGLSEAERDCILKHERMHISHGDPVIRQIGLLAVCLHWWNPLVWYGFRKMCEDMEMTCDESVLKDARLEEKKIYAEALLRVAMNQSGFLEALYFGESHTEQRVRNLLSKKRENFFAFVLLSFFVAGCTQLFVTVGKDETQESPRENSGNMVEEDTENGPEETTLPDMSGYSLEQMPVELQDVILCNASVVSNKDPFRIQLVMTEGEYFTEEYAGAGGGTFKENYRGTYELRILNTDGKELSALRLQNEFGEDVFNFGGTFELALADYNQDGCVDFTLETWGSSSMGIYYLYTIQEDGTVCLAYPEEIATIGFAFNSGRK